jgi:hypothetical protein
MFELGDEPTHFTNFENTHTHTHTHMIDKICSNFTLTFQTHLFGYDMIS